MVVLIWSRISPEGSLHRLIFDCHSGLAAQHRRIADWGRGRERRDCVPFPSPMKQRLSNEVALAMCDAMQSREGNEGMFGSKTPIVKLFLLFFLGESLSVLVVKHRR